MTHPPVLIIHKDHPIHLGGVNGGAEAATLALARALTRHGVQVVLGCMLTDGAPRTTDFEVIDLGSRYNCRGALEQVSARGRYYLLSGGRALPPRRGGLFAAVPVPESLPETGENAPFPWAHRFARDWTLFSGVGF